MVRAPLRGLTQPLPGHLFLGDGRRAAASVDKLSITVAARRRLHTNCFPLFSTSPILSSPSRRQTRLLYIRFRVALLDIRIAVGATGLLSTTQTASFYKCEHLHSLGGGRSHTKEGTAGAIGAPKSGTCVSLCGFEWTPVSVSVSR